MGFIVTLIYLAIIIGIIAGMWKVFTKAGKPGWAAIIPIYNIIVLLQIVNKPIWWIVLFLIPYVNLVAFVLVGLAVAEAFGKSNLFGVGLGLLGPIFYPILGFGDAKYQGLQASDKASAAWLTARENCQFKRAYEGTGVALDTTARIIYLKDKQLEKSYPFSDIREWKYNKSTGGHVIGGSSLGSAGTALGHNLRMNRENKEASGFFINVRDIENPQWRIAFPYDNKMEAEFLKWMEIFKQHINNE